MLTLRKIERPQTMLAELPSGHVTQITVVPGDVVARYRQGGHVVAVWRWHESNKPTRRNRRVMLNCASRVIVWEPQA